MDNIASKIDFLGAQAGFDNLHDTPIVAITVRLDPPDVKTTNYILSKEHAIRLHRELSIAIRSPAFVN